MEVATAHLFFVCQNCFYAEQQTGGLVYAAHHLSVCQMVSRINVLFVTQRFTKTLNYCQRFSKFENRSTIKAIRQMLNAKKLHRFELAALANLCPETPEEAKALIPRLVKACVPVYCKALYPSQSRPKSFVLSCIYGVLTRSVKPL